MKTKQKMVFLIAFTFFITGCVTWQKVSENVNSLLLESSSNIVGKWKFEDPSLGQHVVAFQMNGTYEVDLNGDGAKDVWGDYLIYQDRMKFTDMGGQIGSTCHDSGYYNYTIKGNELHFEFLGDQCRERIKALSALWVRVQSKK